jgi:hypothetical protein
MNRGNKQRHGRVRYSIHTQANRILGDLDLAGHAVEDDDLVLSELLRVNVNEQ